LHFNLYSFIPLIYLFKTDFCLRLRQRRRAPKGSDAATVEKATTLPWRQRRRYRGDNDATAETKTLLPWRQRRRSRGQQRRSRGDNDATLWRQRRRSRPRRSMHGVKHEVVVLCCCIML